MDDILIAIPVFNPEPGLFALCEELEAQGVSLLVVDDGSTEDLDRFDRLPGRVILVRHAMNLGKGAAIKTAFAWAQANLPQCKVIVFADGDGQHGVPDIIAVARRALETQNVTLGVRAFDGDVPFRSRFGNVITSFLVRCVFGYGIYDTQTGLRAMPAWIWKDMMALPGDRYEYEMRLFGLMSDMGARLEQVPIRTIYIESNRTSHFRPVRDSLKIYRGLFGMSLKRFSKFSLSSMIGFLVDNLVFTAFLFAVSAMGFRRNIAILCSLLVARLTSAAVNYVCNRKFVFHSAAQIGRSAGRYGFLVILIASLSYTGTSVMSWIFDASGIAITSLKIIVETILFIISYKVQRRWVFRV